MKDRPNKDRNPQKPQSPPERKPGGMPAKDPWKNNDTDDKKRPGRGTEEPMDREEVEDIE